MRDLHQPMYETPLFKKAFSNPQKLSDHSQAQYGPFAQIYQSFNEMTPLMIKKIDLKDISFQVQQDIINRLHLVKSIEHPNIMKIYKLKTQDKILNISTQYCSINLDNMLKSGKIVEQSEAFCILKDLLQGYKQLIDKGISLPAFKPSNIYLKYERQKLVAKIGDFGIHQIYLGKEKAKNILSTRQINYNSPQYARSKKCSQQNIVWAMGVVFFQLLRGQLPWEAFYPSEYQKIINYPPGFEKISASCQTKSLIQQMLNIDDQQRISFKKLYEYFQPLKVVGVNRDQQIDNMPEYYEIYNIFRIASGAYGSVYKCGKYAIKMMNFSKLKKEQLRILKRETEIQMQMQHENIVRLYEFFEENLVLYSVMEYCETDLHTYRKSQPNKMIKESEALVIFRQILIGYSQLLKKGIVHRDLKPANILITKNNIVKIADFGFSRFVQSQFQVLNTLVGTPYYMSPQILKSQKYSSKSDIWSLGIILYEILFGQFPWNGKNEWDLIQNIHKLDLTFPKVQFSSQTQYLLQQMLQKQQFQRMSWSDLFDKFNIKYESFSPVKKKQPLSCKEINIQNIQNRRNTIKVQDQNRNVQQVTVYRQNKQNKQNKQNRVHTPIKKYKNYITKKEIKKFSDQNAKPKNVPLLQQQNYVKLSLPTEQIRYFLILQINSMSEKNNHSNLKYKLHTCYYGDLDHSQKQTVKKAIRNFSPQMLGAITRILNIQL